MKIFVAGATDAVGLPLVRAVHPGSRGHGHDARRPSGVVAHAMCGEMPKREHQVCGMELEIPFGHAFDRQWKLFSNRTHISAERRRRVASSTRTIGDAF